MSKKFFVLLMVLAAGACSFAKENLPGPVLDLNFERADSAQIKLGKGKGLAGSNSLDMAPNDAEPVVIRDEKILRKLKSLKSITVTGWVKKPVTFDDIDYDPPIVLACPGLFQVMFDKWGRLGMFMTGEDGRRKQVWAGWINIVNFNPDDRWVFFAFSYDGTKSGPNCLLYYGYQEYPIELEIFAPADSGQKQDNPDDMWVGGQRYESSAGILSSKVPTRIIVGAANEKGKSKVNGHLDNIKIFAGSKDNSAALKPWQIEQVRLNDIGDDAFNEAAIKLARRNAEQQKQDWFIEDKYWSEELNLHQVDVLTRVFADHAPKPLVNPEPTSVPRGGKVSFMFAVMSRQKAEIDAKISIERFKSSGLSNEMPQSSVPKDVGGFPATLYHVKHVPIEANNNGGIRTTISSCPPQIWRESIIRQAPFRVAEVLIPTEDFKLRENNMHIPMYKAILVDVEVPHNAKPGVYSSVLTLKTDGGVKKCPFSFKVHKTAIAKEPKLNNVIWFKADPKNLTTGDLPELWSDEHWKLIENSAKTLRAYGQNTISIAMMDHSFETVNFIQTVRKKDSSYDFDFTMFDRWFETFKRAGFEHFEGECTFGGHNASARNVKALDKKTGKYIDIFTVDSDFDDWLEFMGVFYEHLYEHLGKKGWRGNYVQGVIDEPTNMERYMKAYNLTKEKMPDIPTKEACGNLDYSPYIDIQVFNMSLFKTSYQVEAKKRRAQGKGVWFYHCASPYPPYPNRHLDDPLSCSRLFPWLTFMINADGYLFWAANNYRGADPYKSSIGPLPGGVVNPGHPPGDDWLYYPGPEGLLGSMRQLAFRDGLIDYDLLDMLSKKNRKLADKIINEIIRTPVDYDTEPAKYNAMRKRLLEALDRE